MRQIGLACLLGASLSLTACTDAGPEIRPLTATSGGQISAFDKAYELGKAHLAAGRKGLAVVAFDRALALDPRSTAALNGLGTAYDELGRYDIAQTYYRKALQLEPDSADTLNNLAVSLRLAGKADARGLLEEARRLDPGNRVILRNLASLQADETPTARQVALAPSGTAPPPAGDGRDADESRPRIERSAAAEYRLVIAPVAPGAGAALGAPAPAAAAAPAASEVALRSDAALPPEPAASNAGNDGFVPAEVPYAEPIVSAPVAPIAVRAPVEAAAPSEQPAAPVIGAPVEAAAPSEPPPAPAEVALADRQETLIAAAAPDIAPVIGAPAAAPVASAPATIEVAAMHVAPPAPEPAAVWDREPGRPPRVEISNGAGRPHMAARFRDFLRERDAQVRRITNARPFDHGTSVVLYRRGWEQQAKKLASLLPVAARTEADDGVRDDIRVILGHDLLAFDRKLGG